MERRSSHGRSLVGRSLFRRALAEQRTALLAWFGGLGLYCAAMLAVFPTIHGNSSFAKLLQSYPKAFRSMFALADFTTGPGYLRGEIFSLMGPILVVLLAVLWGSDVTAGEEERHTIDLLCASPISRRRVVAEKWAAMTAGVIAVTSVFAIVLGLGAPSCISVSASATCWRWWWRPHLSVCSSAPSHSP